MSNKSNRIQIIIFITFLMGIFLLNLLIPDKDFSESENRTLAKLPELSWKSIKSGRFSGKFANYIKDQFAFKDNWVGIKSDIERLILKSENNGVFFGKDGFLLEHYKKPDKTLAENIESINIFTKRNPELVINLLLVPNSVKIYEDKLPLFASPQDQLEIIELVNTSLKQDINFFDIYDILHSKKDEYIYFRTDHHWTMRGAYYAYEAVAKKLGIKAYNMNKFNSNLVTESFYGSYYAKANNRHIIPDSIEIFQPKFDIANTVCFQDEAKCTEGLYYLQHLQTNDKYAVFLDGNHPLVTINTNMKNNRKLVIFKDSYAHCFIPFLVNHYEEIHVIDLRYYKLDVNSYIKEQGIKEALFLYSISNFTTDKSISWLN